MTTLQEAAQKALKALEVATTPLAKDRKEVLAAMSELRTALAQQGEQHGWKLVPVETTKEMRMAAGSAYLDTHGYADSWIEAVYKAMLAAAPAPQPAQWAVTGCACRWDADDNRVATCVRHQGWLDVVSEWADRAKAAEAALKSAQSAPQPAQAMKAEFEKLLGEYWDIAHTEGETGLSQSNEANEALCKLRALLQSAQPVAPHECKTEAEKLAYTFGWWKALEVNRVQPVAPMTDADIRELADCIVANLDGRSGVINLDLDDDLVEEIMQEMCDTIRVGIKEVK